MTLTSMEAADVAKTTSLEDMQTDNRISAKTAGEEPASHVQYRKSRHSLAHNQMLLGLIPQPRPVWEMLTGQSLSKMPQHLHETDSSMYYILYMYLYMYIYNMYYKKGYQQTI